MPVMTSSLLGASTAVVRGWPRETLNTARQTGGVIGVALFGSLIGDDLVGGLRLALVISVGLALLVAALASGVTADG